MAAFTRTCKTLLTLMTTTEHPQTLRGFPSLSILHRPLHSPNFLLESTRINGIWCSLHNAVTNFLYCGSSQLSAKIARTAWRLYVAAWFECKQRNSKGKTRHDTLLNFSHSWCPGRLAQSLREKCEFSFLPLCIDAFGVDATTTANSSAVGENDNRQRWTWNGVVTLTCQGLCMLDGCHAPNHWRSTISSTLLATLCWCPSVHQELGLGLGQVHCYSREETTHKHINYAVTLKRSSAKYTMAQFQVIWWSKLNLARNRTERENMLKMCIRRITNDMYCAKCISFGGADLFEKNHRKSTYTSISDILFEFA